jgi:hypothetical protein
MIEGEKPDIFLSGLATPGLLAEAAEDAPLLLVVDDTHWLDRPSCEVRPDRAAGRGGALHRSP